MLWNLLKLFICNYIALKYSLKIYFILESLSQVLLQAKHCKLAFDTKAIGFSEAPQNFIYMLSYSYIKIQKKKNHKHLNPQEKGFKRYRSVSRSLMFSRYWVRYVIFFLVLLWTRLPVDAVKYGMDWNETECCAMKICARDILSPLKIWLYVFDLGKMYWFNDSCLSDPVGSRLSFK